GEQSFTGVVCISHGDRFLTLNPSARSDESLEPVPVTSSFRRLHAGICLNRRMAALYRKYRPQSFADVVGQDAVVRTLSNAITTDALRQAYLFAGPRGTGKTSMAR